MADQKPRLINLDHYRPEGLKGWRFDQSHADAIAKILHRSAGRTPPETTGDKTPPDRIDWLPRGWPPTVPAPVDLSQESVNAFCDHLTNVVACVTHEITQGHCRNLDVSFTNETLAINYVATTLDIPSPFGANVQNSNQRDAAALLQAIQNLRTQRNENATVQQSQDLDSPLTNLTPLSRRLLDQMLKATKRATFDDLTDAWGDLPEDDTAVKALKRLRRQLPKSDWDFEISKERREIVWFKKKGQNVP